MPSAASDLAQCSRHANRPNPGFCGKKRTPAQSLLRTGRGRAQNLRAGIKAPFPKIPGAGNRFTIDFPRVVSEAYNMMTITDSLIVEHFVFESLFDRIETLLPGLEQLNEVQLLGGLVEHLLVEHGGQEENLAYAALDQLLADRGRLEVLYQDHQEIDLHLTALKTARTLPEARRLLQKAIRASRKHFQREEHLIFPEFEKVFQAETLAELARARLNRDVAPAQFDKASGNVLVEK